MAGKKVYPKRSGKVAPAVKSYVKKAMRTNSELKRLEIFNQESLQGIPPSGTAIFPSLAFSVAEGTASNERVGNEVRLQGIQVKGMWHNNVNLTIYCRVMIGYYNTVDNLYSAINENTPLFKASDGQSVSSVTIASGATKNYALMTTPTHPIQWTSLYDKVFKIGPSTSTDGNNTRLFNKFIKLHNKKVSWVNTGSIPLPQLQVLRFYSDAPLDASTVQTVEYSGSTQVWYRDI